MPADFALWARIPPRSSFCFPLRCPRDGREQDLGWKPRRPLCHRIADGHSVRLLVVYVDSIQGQSYALNVFGISPAKYSHSKQMYVLLLLGNKRNNLAWRRKRILTHVFNMASLCNNTATYGASPCHGKSIQRTSWESLLFCQLAGFYRLDPGLPPHASLLFRIFGLRPCQ